MLFVLFSMYLLRLYSVITLFPYSMGIEYKINNK